MKPDVLNASLALLMASGSLLFFSLALGGQLPSGPMSGASVLSNQQAVGAALVVTLKQWMLSDV